MRYRVCFEEKKRDEARGDVSQGKQEEGGGEVEGGVGDGGKRGTRGGAEVCDTELEES
jgi:hypothetical protein